ncbi:TauD/TfdA family dioxygenase [Streptosporangium longisporum]|uniref:TauD/TfdA-like domain-containing protein n=1 Tax=Streptosporangium longisporum TaxID=46187 RepID=A0ABN3Y2T4_9ACTN
MTSSIRLTHHRLEDGTRDLLGKEITERVTAAELEPDADEAILARIGAQALSRYLAGEILHGIHMFSVTARHALLLQNLPTQRFPATPVNGFGTETELAVINALHFGLVQLLGITPFAVNYENDGRLIRNVIPNPAASGTASSWGADSEFFWHTDNPHLPFGDAGANPRLYVPRYLTFYAVRNEERVPTELAAMEDAVGRLDELTQRRLQSPSYEVSPPASNDAGAAGACPLSDTALLEQSSEGLRVRYDRGTTRARTAEAGAALQTWSDTLATMPSKELCLEPGDFMIFDNYRVLHRRKAFRPMPPQNARWLRRCYAS